MESSTYRLSSSPVSLKFLITTFLVALSVGYGVSVIQIVHRAGLRPETTVRHYRGVESGEELFVPQSTGTMISVAHVHSFSQSVVIGLVGLLFLFTGYSERAKIFWTASPFLGSLVSLVCPWLIRDVSPRFVIALYISGSLMFLGFGVMAFAILRETWSRSYMEGCDV